MFTRVPGVLTNSHILSDLVGPSYCRMETDIGEQTNVLTDWFGL